jgi:3-oxoacyl-(acyl-carrier-protein) synthase
MLHNQAMHRMPKPLLRDGFVTGDGGRYNVLTLLDIAIKICE